MNFDRLQQIDSFDVLGMLGHPQRLAILQHLMATPATLSQLARLMGTYPAQIRHHLKLLEDADLVAMMSTRIVRGFVEKYYQATARAYYVNLNILPEQPKRKTILALGSHDLALELLAEHLRGNTAVPDLIALPVGSLDGLIALRQGLCQLSGCHLLDPDSGEYNRSYVRHLFPGEEMTILTLAHRQQGLLLLKGNPKQIRSLADVARPDIRFVNRKRGTGTRLWLDQTIDRLEIPKEQVQGYEQAVSTHLQVAQAVAEGKVDTGTAVLAAAQRFDLDFVPLFEERYDLVLPTRFCDDPLLDPLLDYLQTAVFRRQIASLDGYDSSQTGSQIPV
ncbi:MAG: helix-turn-helix domain-containing protein [Ardenticatenaceae bacterium]|nr:helix-turn-helix domain-containing protein [Ardenticatenaceae bacterium]